MNQGLKKVVAQRATALVDLVAPLKKSDNQHRFKRIAVFFQTLFSYLQM